MQQEGKKPDPETQVAAIHQQISKAEKGRHPPAVAGGRAGPYPADRPPRGQASLPCPSCTITVREALFQCTPRTLRPEARDDRGHLSPRPRHHPGCRQSGPTSDCVCRSLTLPHAGAGNHGEKPRPGPPLAVVSRPSPDPATSLREGVGECNSTASWMLMTPFLRIPLE